jgi:hypothetical protein
MESYQYHTRLKQIWEDALSKYESGLREPNEFFSTEVLAELASIGLNVMDVYDYVEDYVRHGEPDFETFLMICEARRDYFLTEQNAKPSDKRLDNETLPAKTDEVEGMVWLPRLMPKALAKLRGELPPETMFCCGGDRKFFKQHDIHPAEFLRATWAYQDDPTRLVDWVRTRKVSELTS